jgi:hypothetical protein
VPKKEVGIDKNLHISSQPFLWTAWTTSFGAVDESLPRKININTQALPLGFHAPAVIEYIT